MKTRVTLRSPFGETLVRDIVEGLWREPSGNADRTIGEDLWALPGLVDAHSHIATAELDYRPGNFDHASDRARRALTAGVMLLLDKGWSDTTAIEVADALPLDERPDIEAAAKIISVPDGYIPGFTREISASEVAEAVADEASRSAGWVKLIGDWPRRGAGPLPNFTEAQLNEAVRTAESAGCRVAIHTMARDVPSAAVRAGVHSIEHGLFLTEDDLGPLGDRAGMWVPTVLRVDETIRRLGLESSGGRLLAEGLDNIERLMPLALEAGVHVLPGTDLMGSSAQVADEAVRLTQCGLSPTQAVEAIARTGFVATGRSFRFEVDTPANAVLFGEDPTAEVESLRHPKAVIRRGRLL